MSKKIIFIIFLIFFILGFSLFFWFYEVRFMGSRAYISGSFSKENSYVFASPLQAKANGQEKIRVTVFVLDDRGIGVMGKKVFLEKNKHLKIEEIQALTDNFGKSYFDISSEKAGEYYLRVFVDDIEINQKVHLSYY